MVIHWLYIGSYEPLILHYIYMYMYYMVVIGSYIYIYSLSTMVIIHMETIDSHEPCVVMNHSSERSQPPGHPCGGLCCSGCHTRMAGAAKKKRNGWGICWKTVGMVDVDIHFSPLKERCCMLWVEVGYSVCLLWVFHCVFLSQVWYPRTFVFPMRNYCLRTWVILNYSIFPKTLFDIYHLVI